MKRGENCTKLKFDNKKISLANSTAKIRYKLLHDTTSHADVETDILTIYNPYRWFVKPVLHHDVRQHRIAYLFAYTQRSYSNSNSVVV